jgi:amino acid transporter
VQALWIVVIANAITLLTTLSLSALSTNLQVREGGAFFLILRKLGLEIGGAVGIPLFLAQAVLVAFYIIGFTESLEFLFPDPPSCWVSVGTLGVILMIAWAGAELAVKTQYFIMAALGCR